MSDKILIGALQYIVSHKWVADNKDNAWKWINDFVAVAEKALDSHKDSV